MLALILAVAVIYLSVMVVRSVGNDTYLSERVQTYCIEIGEQYSICPELLMAIIERESGGEAHAVGGGCKGLMQISDKWHRDRMDKLGVKDIFDERGNITVGADYLAELFEQYDDVGVVLAAYHGEKDPEQGDISEYTKWIMERSEQLERLHGK